MHKNIVKVESLEEFLARGGAVTKCATKTKTRRTKRAEQEFEVEEVDYNLLPENLKIRFGIRNAQEAK